MKQLKLALKETKKVVDSKSKDTFLHFTKKDGKKRALRVDTITSFIEPDEGGCVMITENGFRYHAIEKYEDLIALLDKI